MAKQSDGKATTTVEKPKRKFVPNKDFVLCWEEHNGDPIKVSSILGINPLSARMRAKKMRGLGYPVCEPVNLPRGRKLTPEVVSAEIAELKKLLRERSKAKA